MRVTDRSLLITFGVQILMAARSNSRRRSYGASRKDCVKYKLLGKCDYGGDCKFAHEYRAPRTFTAYIQLPKGLPLGMAIGKKHSNLKPIMSAVEFQIRASERSEETVEVITASKDALAKAVEKLSALFAQVYPLGPTWCYIHTEGITEVAGKLLLQFMKYQGKFPTHLFHGQRHNPMYEVCCCESGTSGDTSAHDTSLEELKKLNPTSSPLDSMDKLHTALDSMHIGAVSSHSQRALTVCPTARARIMTEYKEDIRNRLQGALEWGLKNQSPCHMFKLEARFGKVLWFNLPDDVTADDKPWGVEQFADFVFTDTIHSQCFNTDVKKQNAEQLRAELSDPKPLLETFDIKLSTTFAGQGRHKLDLRLKLRGGKLEVILLKQNETKVVTFDILNLHREHDVRISLNRLEILPETHQLYGVAHRLFQSLTIPKPGTLEFIPCADNWNVEFIRHKKRTAYVIDDKCMVTITAIQEYRTDWEKLPKGQTVTVNFDDIPEHIEVEVHNSVWACTFGKDVGFTPEKALALHTEHPAVAPQLVASIPHPWGVQDILQDYDEFLDYLDQLNESLGIIG